MQGRRLRHFSKVHECLTVSNALIVFVSAVTSVLILFGNLETDFFFPKIKADNKNNTGL